MRKIILTVIAVAMLSIPTASPNAATMGCLLGAPGGGFGGAQLGKGKGKLALTALGTLLGCGVGSAIQDRDQQQYQRQAQPRPQPQYMPTYPQQNVRPSYRYQQITRPSYQPVYPRQQAMYQWQPAPRPVIKAAPVQRSCPYSREYQDTVAIGNKEVPAYGRACSYDGGQNWDLGPLTPAQ